MSMTDLMAMRWDEVAERAARHAAACELTLNPLDLGNACASYATLHVSALDGQQLAARLIVPQTPGAHPIVLAFHDATRGVRGWHHLTRFVALDCAVLALENRPGVEGVLISEPPVVGDGLGIAMRLAGDEPPHIGRSLDATTRTAVAATFADALVLAHVARRLDGVDTSRLICWGEGLGGGIALVVAALAGTFAAAALNPLPAALDEAACDVDVARIAAGLACPVLLGTCQLDLQATPEAQDAIAAGLGSVTHVRYPRYLHERVNAFEDALLSFLVETLSPGPASP